jgi:hypothetical protein
MALGRRLEPPLVGTFTDAEELDILKEFEGQIETRIDHPPSILCPFSWQQTLTEHQSVPGIGLSL